MLTDLSPLDNLAFVGEYFNIINNASLTNLSGLENIDLGSINELGIYNNPILSECDAQSICDYLVSPNGTVNIHDNAVGCNSQQEVEDDCKDNCLPEGIEFETQASIDNFQTNYPGCTEIEGDVTIGEYNLSSNITNLDGLSVLTAIGGYLDIRFNNNLVSLSGLSNLTSVGDILSVLNNGILTDLTGLDQLTNVGDKVYIAYNDYLTNLTGLENLTFVSGDFVIRENPSLVSLTGIENLNTIEGALEIRVNDVLTNLAELSSLNSLGTYLWIGGNDNLSDLTGLEGLTTIADYLDIAFNNTLPDLTGLNNITSIGGYLDIHNSDAIMQLTGLENLTSIGGNMYIRNNANFNNLSALSELTIIDGEFRVSGNPMLTSLSGLNNIEANSISDLYLHDNTSLSTCEIESVCNYLAAPNGAIYIVNNATGCATQEEVEEACWSSVDYIGCNDVLTISPNPTSGATHLRYTIYEQGFTIFKLFQISGIKIKQIINEVKIPGTYEMEIDLSDLPKGLYFCILKTNEGIQTKKIIKL